MGMILLDEGGGKRGGGYGLRQNGAPVSPLSVAFLGLWAKVFSVFLQESKNSEKNPKKQAHNLTY